MEILFMKNLFIFWFFLMGNLCISYEKLSPLDGSQLAMAPQGETYWNGNHCFYSNGVDGNWISVLEKGAITIPRVKPLKFLFLSETVGLFEDPINKKKYTYYSERCNKNSCTDSNLLGADIPSGNFFHCPSTALNLLADVSNGSSLAYRNGYCYYTPKSYSVNPVNCFVPRENFGFEVFHGSSLDKMSSASNFNIDDNNYCYMMVADPHSCKPSQCNREYLDANINNILQQEFMDNSSPNAKSLNTGYPFNFVCETAKVNTIPTQLAPDGQVHWNGNCACIAMVFPTFYQIIKKKIIYL
jgi:hypothetical protein